MEIDIRSLQFDNCLRYETRQKKEDWLIPFNKLEDFIVSQDIYKDGPIFFSVNSNQEDDYTYYLPINAPVQLPEETEFSFQDSFKLEKALFLRQAVGVMDVNVAVQKLKDYAEFNEIELEDTYFFVVHELYNDYIIDLFCPILEAGGKE
ncbi:hypothetical protein [Sporosarcina sp. JAI121]|uniref:hypothetical protein n=1 Tax=Sporosarcina sp. JAI121 TaxID=2723064 RepID=UPI0015CA21E2|nr:hypothetical protein [Sporosarcina sp. JAI121]NYF23599.1 hypothetical protein [Sporosarcina sp. JAI121]